MFWQSNYIWLGQVVTAQGKKIIVIPKDNKLKIGLNAGANRLCVLNGIRHLKKVYKYTLSNLIYLYIFVLYFLYSNNSTLASSLVSAYSFNDPSLRPI